MATYLLRCVLLFVLAHQIKCFDLEDTFADVSTNYNHDRFRREADIPDSPINPTETEFYLIKTGVYENVTEMTFGSKIHLMLAIHFPIGPTDIEVELITPSNDTTVLSVCSPEITFVGSALDLNISLVDIKLEGKEPDATLFDRAILNLGNITNDGTASVVDDALIKIEWDAVMVANNDTENGKVYWISAGADYDNSSDIWIGQAGFIANTENWDPPDNPTFNFTGPTAMEIGSSAVFQVEFYIPFPVASLSFDAFAPLNDTDIMSVCNVLIKEMGESFSCYDHISTPQLELFPSDSGNTNKRARLEMGWMTNARSREDDRTEEMSTITISFVLVVNDDTSLIGENYQVGAALEVMFLDSVLPDLIWAGQFSVDVIDHTNTSFIETNAHPTFNMNFPTPTSCPCQTVQFELDMDTVPGSEIEYNLEVFMPLNNSIAGMRVCRVDLIESGVNVPTCGTNITTVFSSRNNDEYVSDVARYEIGSIKNFDLRTPIPSRDIYSNRLKFGVIGEFMDTYEEDTLEVSFDMRYSDNQLWTGQLGISIPTELRDENYTTTLPSFNMTYLTSNGIVHVHEGVAARIEIETWPGAKYNPLSLELIMPHQNSTKISICRVEVVHGGSNMPCFQQKLVNTKVQYVSKSDETLMYKAIVHLGPLANFGGGDGEDPNKILVDFIVRLEDDPSHAQDDLLWLGAALTHGDTEIWIGQLGLTVDLTAPTINENPYLTSYIVDNPAAEVGVGMPFTVEVLLKLPPVSSTDYKLNVTVQDGLTLCSAKLDELGLNLPCAGQPEDAILNVHASGITHDGLYYHIGVLSNVYSSEEVVMNSTFDMTTAKLLLYGQMSRDVTVGETMTMTITIEYDGADGIQTDNLTITAVTPGVLNTTEQPGIDLYAVNLLTGGRDTTSTISLGQSVVVRLELEIPPYTSDHLIVKFITPIGTNDVLEICDVNVLSIGDNIPCFKRDYYYNTSIYTPRNGDPRPQVGTIDLGHVCALNTTGNQSDSKIVIEGIARLHRYAPVNQGDEVALFAGIDINDDVVILNSINFTVSSTFDDSAFSVGDSSVEIVPIMGDNSYNWRPGSVYDIQYAVFIAPETTFNTLLDIKVPVSTSAFATIQSISIVSVGRNIGCFLNDPIVNPTVLTSTDSTSQMDHATVDLGVITNTGVTGRTGYETADDNKILINATIQMADFLLAENGFEEGISLGIRLGNTLIFKDVNVTVTRDNLEEPVLNNTVFSDQVPTYDASTNIVISVNVSQTTSSSAEAYNITTYFYIPSFLNYVGMTSTQVNVPPPKVNNNGNGMISVTIERLYFTDEAVSYSIELSFDTSVLMPITGSTVRVIEIPYDSSWNMIVRQSSIYPDGYFFEDMHSFVYSLDTSSQQACTSTPLGIQSGVISDCQITGSLSPFSDQQPHHARLGSGTYWTSSGRGTSSLLRYIQVQFLNLTRVNSIEISHAPVNEDVSSYQIQYSNDGIRWSNGETINPSTGGSDSTDVVTDPQSSYFIRLVILTSASTDQERFVSFSFELHGCSFAEMDGPDLCSNPVWADTTDHLPDIAPRSALVAGNTFYFCDAERRSSNGEEVQCFSAALGTGSEIIVLDKNLYSVIGYESVANELVAIDYWKRSILCSQDSGDTWFSISHTRYAEMTALSTYTEKVNVPWLDYPALDEANTADYTWSTWKANYEGIYYNDGSWNKIVSWDSCCP